MADAISFSQQEDEGNQNEHDEKMAGVFDKGTGDNDGSDRGENVSGDNDGQQDENRPDWLPDNFKSVEDYVKSNEEQRSTLTKLQQELAELKKGKAPDDETDDGEGDDEDDDEDDKKEKKEGEGRKGRDYTPEDLEKYTTELAEAGELSDESRQELLDQFDVPEFMLDTYLQGVKAISDNQTQTLNNAFGGEEQRDAMLAWAGENMSEGEVETLNKQFESNDLNTMLFAADALKTKYEAAEGKAPEKRLNGDGRPNTNGAYQSWEQVNRDMADPKYREDPAFRAQVKTKLANSRI